MAGAHTCLKEVSGPQSSMPKRLPTRPFAPLAIKALRATSLHASLCPLSPMQLFSKGISAYDPAPARPALLHSRSVKYGAPCGAGEALYSCHQGDVENSWWMRGVTSWRAMSRASRRLPATVRKRGNRTQGWDLSQAHAACKSTACNTRPQFTVAQPRQACMPSPAPPAGTQRWAGVLG